MPKVPWEYKEFDQYDFMTVTNVPASDLPLVVAGHVTTQNLGGKKTCWMGGVVGYFVW